MKGHERIDHFNLKYDHSLNVFDLVEFVSYVFF